MHPRPRALTSSAWGPEPSVLVSMSGTLPARAPTYPARVPPALLVLGAASSVQFGAAFAATIFDDLGPAGASTLRVGFAAVILMAIWRPRVRGVARADLLLAAQLGLTLGVMNYTFYESLDRLPLGIAVTIEFIGPLGLAVALSRRRLDFVWIGLAAAGILLLAKPGGGGVDPVGLVLVLIAAACWALYIVLAARAG